MIKKNNIQGLEKAIHGDTALATNLLGDAFQAGNRKAFELLLKRGANVNHASLNTEWGPYPLLHHFARNEELYWLKTSIEHGGILDLESRNGITPLSESIEGKKSENALYLIDAGANIHGRIQNKPFYDLAIGNMLFEAAFKMLELKADPNSITFHGATAIDHLRDYCSERGGPIVNNVPFRPESSVWCTKILQWYKDRDLDILNATFVIREEKLGNWKIPSFTQENSQPQ